MERLKLFAVGIFCAFTGLVRPKEMREMYLDADLMKQMKDRCAAMNRRFSLSLEREGQKYAVAPRKVANDWSPFDGNH